MPSLRIAPLVLFLFFSAEVATPAEAAAYGWHWPVRGRLLEPFHYGPDPFRAGQHRGIDIAARTGTPVRSACAGRVRFAGTAGDAGRTVSVNCDGLTASYLHLRSIAVRRGQRVGVGDRLGEVGSSGRPRRRTPHLHLGARRTGDRFAYVDPLSLLPDGGSEEVPVTPLLRRTPPVPAVPGVGPPALGRAPAPVPLTARAPHSTPAPRPLPVVARGRTPALPWTLWAGLALLALAVPAPAIRLRRRGRLARRREAAPGVAAAP